MYTLTIITPIYNTPIDFLKECIQSVKDSNIDFPYEHLLINDGSSEISLINYLEDLEDENIRVLNINNNGVSYARNYGIKNSLSKYILCLDSDDVLLPKINDAILFLERNIDFGIVYCDIEYFGDLNSIYNVGEFSKFKLLYITNFIHECTLIRRESLDILDYVYNVNLNWSEGLDLYTRMATKEIKFKYISTPFFKYRRIFNGKSLSQQKETDHFEIRTFIKKQFNPHKEISVLDVNQYVINHFNQNYKSLIKLLIIILFPFFFKLLKKNKIFKNDIVVD